jgi:hypothetical protein
MAFLKSGAACVFIARCLFNPSDAHSVLLQKTILLGKGIGLRSSVPGQFILLISRESENEVDP